MPFKAIGRAFKKLGKGFVRVFKAAEKVGLTDALLGIAEQYVKEAALLKATNDERREYVIAKLRQHEKIPEHLARLITEMAVTAWKDAGGAADEIDAEIDQLVKDADV